MRQPENKGKNTQKSENLFQFRHESPFLICLYLFHANKTRLRKEKLDNMWIVLHRVTNEEKYLKGIHTVA